MNGEIEIDDDQAAAGFSTKHNILLNSAETIRACHRRVQSASRESLDDLCLAGHALSDAKDALADAGKGAFGRWCQDLPFSRTWRARLMRLAANFDDVVAAVNALPEEQRNWSVNGALAAWAVKRSSSAPRKRSSVHILRIALAAANDRIAQLEAMSNRLRTRAPSAHAE